MFRFTSRSVLLVCPLWALLSPVPSLGGVIYEHNFGGDGSLSIDGLVPDVDNSGQGVHWASSQFIRTDGSTTSNSVAYLPMPTIQTGDEYLLTVWMQNPNDAASGSINAGFLRGTTPPADVDERFARQDDAILWNSITRENSLGTDGGFLGGIHGEPGVPGPSPEITGPFTVSTKEANKTTIRVTANSSTDYTVVFAFDDGPLEIASSVVSNVDPTEFGGIGYVAISSSGGGKKFDLFRLELVDPDSADFDEDGDVDVADLMIWQRGYDVGTTRGEGDANGDQMVDSFDLDVWRQQFGTGALVVAGVPEPGGCLLLASGLFFCFWRGARMGRQGG